jgi:hypothetical protein
LNDAQAVFLVCFLVEIALLVQDDEGIYEAPNRSPVQLVAVQHFRLENTWQHHVFFLAH